jgi:hypothetical protein
VTRYDRDVRGIAIAIGLGCAACNAILGLDPTHRADDAQESQIDASADAAPPDAIAADANPDDVDGDGVINEKDDCPQVFNPDQADEDGDLVGDACDNCPELPNSDQRDVIEVQNGQAADGIGDVCDPNQTIGGDERVLFEPFNDPAKLGAWKFPIGTWSESGGALHQTDTGADSALAYFDRAVSTTAIDVQARIEAVGNLAGGSIAAGAWMATAAPTGPVIDGYFPDGYRCALTAATPSSFAQAELDAYAQGGVKESNGLASNHILVVGDGLSFGGIVTSASPPPVRCGPSVPGEAFGLSLPDQIYAGGVVGLHTQHLGVAFTSVTIYSR